MSGTKNQKLVLTYLNLKGIAEPIRLALAVQNLEFEDRRVSYDEIATMREEGKLPFGQVPILEIGDELVIGQSQAILRWVGKRSGLMGLNDDSVELRVNIMMEAIGDIHKALLPAWYKNACSRSPVNGTFFEDTKLTDTQYDGVVDALNKEILPTRFQLLEREHLKYGPTSRFLCGDTLTIADLMLYTLITGLQSSKKDFCEPIDANVVGDCPALLEVVRRVGDLKEVKAWNVEHE